MVNELVGVIAMGTVILLPLAWREWRDRAQDRAQQVRADVDHAVRRALGGESFVAVEVTPRLFARSGQVILSTPTGWDHLVQLALPNVLERVPPHYELVVRPGDRAGGRAEHGRKIAHATA